MAKKIERPASKAKDARAFSRRYDTSEQHDKAQCAWDDHQDAVMDGVARRKAACAKLTPLQRLEILDGRPGHSRRERERLNKMIKAAAKAA